MGAGLERFAPFAYDGPMKKLFFILMFFAQPVAAEKLSLGELSKYLNDLYTAQGDFTQINPDGSTSTGKIFIKRPGRIRFEYTPPEKALVLAGGGQVAIFDPKAGEPTRFPLNQTPLHVILKRHVDLTATDMVVDHAFDGTRTAIVAQDPDRPEYGYIQLVFTDNPVQLREWIVDDGAGSATQVIIGNWAEGVRVPGRLFTIQSEMQKYAQ